VTAAINRYYALNAWIIEKRAECVIAHLANFEFYYMDSRIEDQRLRSPNVALVTGSLLGGGAERVLSDMANYWANKGWAVMFATWSGAGVEDTYELDPRVTRIWLDVGDTGDSMLGKLRFNVRRLSKLRNLLSESKPDAVLSFISTSNILTLLATVGLRIKVVVSERIDPAEDSTISLGWRFLRRICYPLADGIVSQSDDAAEWVSRHIGRQPTIIPNPLRQLPDIVSERQHLIVAVGRLAKQKGFDLLLKAFSEIASEHESWNVVVVGEGAEKDSLLRLRDQLGLAERVQFIGYVRDVESWMAKASLVVQPSRFEGFPNVLLESMGMGAAVISADCPSGPAELIVDGVNGRLVPVEDVGALAKSMAELMANQDLCEALGREASKVRQHFRQDLIMEQWEKCLFADRNALQNADWHERGNEN
jgi:glycosyltransferase involved in cell wall biosynthesis